MTVNERFLEAIRNSFRIYLEVGSSQSTAKLKPLHGCIAEDLREKFGDGFSIHAQGTKEDREFSVSGRYYDKKVDVTVVKDGKAVAGYSVKFVMRNYLQNTNNYFENMLGETANIRTVSIPYFQVFIVFDKVPYYKEGGRFFRYDVVTPHNMDKYLALSKDDSSVFFHTPDKTLVVLVKLKEQSPFYHYLGIRDYAAYYRSVIDDPDLLSYASRIVDPFHDGVIYNDYEDFIDRTYHITMGRMKKI